MSNHACTSYAAVKEQSNITDTASEAPFPVWQDCSLAISLITHQQDWARLVGTFENSASNHVQHKVVHTDRCSIIPPALVVLTPDLSKAFLLFWTVWKCQDGVCLIYLHTA